ncbi:MAG: DNA gyrase C-terminal beta-propeller domain-containing protein, partial [Acidimicrobiales bacterium]
AVKSSNESEFPAKGRGTGGVRAMRLRKGQKSIAGVAIGRAEDLLFVMGSGEGLFAKAESDPLALSLDLARRDAVGVDLDVPVLLVGRAR